MYIEYVIPFLYLQKQWENNINYNSADPNYYEYTDLTEMKDPIIILNDNGTFIYVRNS